MKLRHLKILEYPHPALREVCEPVDEVTNAHLELSAMMQEALTRSGGIGLAANQVGVCVRMIIIDTRGKENCPDPLHVTMINPVITHSEGDKKGWEGCLSFPGEKGRVRRATDITVSYTSILGAKKELKLTGINAVVAQHECDHLQGIVFTDHVEE